MTKSDLTPELRPTKTDTSGCAEENDDDEDDIEIEVVGTVGHNALVDSPHSRENCAVHKFVKPKSIISKKKNGTSSSSKDNDGVSPNHNHNYFDNCFCYVCDILASQCNSWTGTDGHCGASHSCVIWRKQRARAKRFGKGSVNATAAAAATRSTTASAAATSIITGTAGPSSVTAAPAPVASTGNKVLDAKLNAWRAFPGFSSLKNKEETRVAQVEARKARVAELKRLELEQERQKEAELEALLAPYEGCTQPEDPSLRGALQEVTSVHPVEISPPSKSASKPHYGIAKSRA
jgi:hypothetical protein